MTLSLFDWTHLAALTTMLVVAVWQDAAIRRIPNTLVLWGSLIALGLSLSSQGLGLGSAIAGGMVGFFGFLVLYLLRAVGAGDVKLVGATGLFVGHPDMLWVNLLILLSGGMLSLAWALFTGKLSKTLQNLHSGLSQILLKRQNAQPIKPHTFPVGRTRIPYAIAIGTGTAVHLLNTWPTR